MTRFLNLGLALLLSLTTVTVTLAQATWEAPLRAQIETLEATSDDDFIAKLTEVTPAFERIALASTDAWLPNYYAARYNMLLHYTAGEDGCVPCLEKMDKFLNTAEAADNNSEVLTMRASYYQAMIGVYPMRTAYYGPKAGNMLGSAMKADPTNPRAASLMGQNLYYTPAMFGGGAGKALPHLERAIKLYEAEAVANDAGSRDLLPTWGFERAKAMLGKAVAEN